MPESSGTARSVVHAVTDYLRAVESSAALQQMHLNGSGAVGELERKLEDHYDVRHALCVSNATTGLLAVALALELRGAQFVTTPLTYGGAIAGLLMLRNTAVFADVERETLTLDPTTVRGAITPRTRAILAVDFLGVPADHRALRDVADEHGLWYIADAAQSFGATRDGLPASALADALVISFTSGKSLFAGEGGAIVTNNDELYERLLWWTQHPNRQSRELGLSLQNEFGINARIHPLAAIWANAEFSSSLARLGVRQEECLRLGQAVNATGLARVPDYRKLGLRPTFRRITGTWTKAAAEAALVAALQELGEAAEVRAFGVEPLYRQPAFRAQYHGRFRRPSRTPIAEAQTRTRFALSPRRMA